MKMEWEQDRRQTMQTEQERVAQTPGPNKTSSSLYEASQASHKKFPSLAERSAQFCSEQCPHCYKKFSNKAALRHIPLCAEKTRAERLAAPGQSRQGPQKVAAASRPTKAGRDSASGAATRPAQLANGSPLKTGGYKISHN